MQILKTYTLIDYLKIIDQTAKNEIINELKKPKYKINPATDSIEIEISPAPPYRKINKVKVRK